jgi:hypothetical protein
MLTDIKTFATFSDVEPLCPAEKLLVAKWEQSYFKLRHFSCKLLSKFSMIIWQKNQSAYNVGHCVSHE